MKLEKTFDNLEEMAQYLRENGYCVYKQADIFPYNVPAYPVYPIYPPQPFYVDTNPYSGVPKIMCKNHIENN